MSITYYWNNKLDPEYHTNLWTNRICVEKISESSSDKNIHILFIKGPHDNDDIFDFIQKNLIGKGYRIVLWNLDHSLYDEYYDTKLLELHELGEDVIKVSSDMNIPNDYPFKKLITYSMADAVLEVQRSNRKLIMGIFKKSAKLGRHKYFLCFNGTPKNYRIQFVNKLYHNDLFDKMDISFLSWFDDNHERFTIDTIKEYSEAGYDEIELPKEMFPMNLDFGRHAHGFYTCFLNLPLYFSSYIDVITMAKYASRGVYLDEKIYKSFICLKPFIIVGQYETLKILKDYGFKTFSPIINEDYDSERDSEKRMDMVIQEVKRLNDMSVFEMDKIFWKFKDILVYNFLHLKKFINDIDDTLIKEICE